MSSEAVRASLLGQLDAISSPQAAVAFQRKLADGIISAELDASDDARWHAHLLRLMGDTLAWRLLSRHVIRELARDRRKPAPLAGQRQDFEFVLDVAERVAREGLVPIVSDLTHLLGVGDVITIASAAVGIIECKNRTLPTEWVPRGRHWRQLDRQARASQYLAAGHVPEGEERRIAIEVAEPPRCDDELQECVERARASKQGAAVTELGERDILAAIWDRGLTPADALGEAFATISNVGWQYPLFGGSATATDHPGPFIANPYALPLPVDARLAIPEGDLLLFRFVDLAPLGWQDNAEDEQISIEVYMKGGSPHLRAQLDGKTRHISDRFIDQIIWDFRSVIGTRAHLKALLQAVRRVEGLPEPERHQAASPEIAAFASFAFRDPGGSPEPLLVSQLREFANLVLTA
jgi:hypothetical protein